MTGLAINTSGVSFLNLNDCEIKIARCDEIFKITGKCDVLISQFVMLHGRRKRKYFLEKKAAQEKLDTLELQVKKFNPKYLIPFASFVSFSNERIFTLMTVLIHQWMLLKGLN